MKQPDVKQSDQTQPGADDGQTDVLERIIDFLRRRNGLVTAGKDKEGIKEGIQRRMLAVKAGSLESYARLIERDNNESDALSAGLRYDFGHVERQLQKARRKLQDRINSLDLSSEELGKVNRNYLDLHEDLLNANEELQLAREELQSMNDELRARMLEAEKLNFNLQNLYESTNIPTVLLDDELIIQDFTPAARQLFRLADQDVGRPLGDIAPRFTPAGYAASIRKAIDTGRKVRIEVFKDDSGEWYNLQITPYRTRHGIEGISLTFFDLDVSTMKQIQSDLYLKEKMLRIITNSAPVLLAFIDLDERYQFINDRYLVWFELRSKDEIRGKSMREVLGEKAYKLLEPRVRQALKGRPVNFEERVPYLRGGERFVRVFYEPYFDTDGKVIGFISLVEDETERKRQILDHARLNAIVSAPNEVIVGKSPEGVVTSWSKGAQELYGYTAEEIIGKDAAVLCPPEYQDELQPIYERVRRGEYIPPFETVRRTRSGKLIHMLLNISAIKDEHQNVIGISAVGHNISERKEAERKLLKLNKSLENRIEERTAQLRKLTSEILRIEHKERMNFSELLHDELQQIMVTIKMHIEHLSDDEGLAEEYRSRLKEVVGLTNDLLNASRALNAELNPPLLFEQGLKPVAEWLRRWAQKQHALKLEYHIRGEDRAISEEIGYFLLRSMKELLQNIVKHAKIDKAYLAIEFGDGGMLSVSLEDRGEGFDVQQISHADDKFGLFTIVERMRSLQGQCVIESVMGKGTKITLECPLSERPTKTVLPVLLQQDIDNIQDIKRTLAMSREDQKRILIADDHKILRDGIRRLVESKLDNVYIEEAADGLDAINKALSFKPQLILMDINLPKVDGIEAIRQIKAKQPDVHIVGLSMYAREDIEDSLYDAGGSYYLTKDQSPAEIVSIIEKYLRIAEAG